METVRARLHLHKPQGDAQAGPEVADPEVAALLLAQYPHVRDLATLESLYDTSGSWELGAGAKCVIAASNPG